MRKKLLSYTLGLAVALTSIVPANMMTSEVTVAEESETTTEVQDDQTENVVTGQCGTYTYFEYGEDKVLKISGEGAIDTKYYKDLIDKGINTEVKKIIMDSTVTSIADNALAGFTSLEKVEMSHNMESIGKCAFENCTSLESIIIPKPTTLIDDYAFGNCTSLELVCIFMKKGVLSDTAFSNCTGMKRLMFVSPAVSGELTIPETWPQSLEIIYPSLNTKYYSLYNYGLTNGIQMYGLNSGDTSYYSDNYVCYNDGFCVVYGYGELGEMSDYAKDIIVAHGITSFAAGIFRGYSKIETLILPASLTAIADSTFVDLSNLKEIEIPEGVESVGAYAFKGCTSLETVVFNNPDTVIDATAFPDTVTTIYGKPGSTAEAYALEKGIAFVNIITGDGSEAETTTEEITEDVTTEYVTTEIITTEESDEETSTEEITTEEKTTEEVSSEEVSSGEITTEDTTVEEITSEESTYEGATTEVSTYEESTTEVQTSEEIEENITTEEITTQLQDSDKETTIVSQENTTTSKENATEENASKDNSENEHHNTHNNLTLQKPIIKKIKEKNYRSVIISWNKVEGAKSYEVYRATGKKGKYKLIKTVTKTTYIDKKVKAGKKYFYKIKAIVGDNKSSLSDAKNIKVKGKPNKPKIKVSKKSNSWSIVWGTIKDNSKGIEIYMKNNLKGQKKFVLINKTTNLKKAKSKKGVTGISSSINSLKAGVKYQFRARTYAVVKGKKVYSKWSKIKTLTK